MSQLSQISKAGFRIGWTFAVASLLVVLTAEGQPTARIGDGEVTADNVYVRSGPSTNHYTICKLSAGDRVTIISQRGEWYEILPPNGAFSLVSGEYVDTADDKSGVVNGNNVRVRAGSQLNKNKYTVQTMLSKGAEVTIIGSEPDGFLRIVPPTGATLWISGNYVELVPDELVKLQHEAESGGSDKSPDAKAPDGKTALTLGSAVMPTGRAVDDARRDSRTSGSRASGVDAETEDKSKSPFAGFPLTDQRRELEQIDDDARKELERPLLERRYAHILKRYGALAEQEEDEAARRYAQLRCEQISRMMEAADSVKKMRHLGEQTEAKRREFLSKRMQLPQMSPPIPHGLDAQGELRESSLYPPDREPRRYRLIDPNEPTARTIGYVEIPADSTIDARSYLGRYVGVRASRTRLQSGGVNPIPIYVASELVLVAPTAGAAGMNGQD